MVDGQGMSAVGHVDEFGDGVVVLGQVLMGGVGDGRRCGVVAVTGDDENRSSVGVLGVGLGIASEWVEVGDGGLEERGTGCRYMVGLVEVFGLDVVEVVGPTELELFEGQRDGLAVIGGVAQDRCC